MDLLTDTLISRIGFFDPGLLDFLKKNEILINQPQKDLAASFLRISDSLKPRNGKCFPIRKTKINDYKFESGIQNKR